MKVRTGYVSNSSSSSFIIRTDMSKDEVIAVMKSIVDFWEDDKFTENDYTIKPITEDFVSGLSKLGICSEIIDIAKENIGHYRVTSIYDNSIHYDLFPFIEKKLHATYFHIGYDFEEHTGDVRL